MSSRAVPRIPSYRGHTTVFYSLCFITLFSSLLFAFAVWSFVKALLGPEIETRQSYSQTKQSCSCREQTVIPASTELCLLSKVDYMETVMCVEQAITSALGCLGRFSSTLQCQIWRLKTNSQQCLFGQTVPVLQTHHTCLCIYFLL